MYDVIVIGLGGMGSAAAYHLAQRGQRVLGLERFTAGHDRGSSHGHSRVIRQAYFEDPAYVPLLLRAYDLWRQLEQETDETLLTITGGLMMGLPDSRVVQGSIRSATEYGLPHELLDAAEIHRRFPPLTPAPEDIALYERAAGFVRPELAVRAHLTRAQALGATLHFEEPVTYWEATNSGVSVTTPHGSYEAERLIIAPGAWASDLFGLQLPLTVTRQVLYWFAPEGGIVPFLPDRFPIYIWEMPFGDEFYGFPAQVESSVPVGVKVAFFYRDTPANPDQQDRMVTPIETEEMREALRSRIPTLTGHLLHATTCMYTETPDRHFIIDQHPTFPNVVLASPCSGHGYKFCSVVGEILADLATESTTNHPIKLFNLSRLEP